MSDDVYVNKKCRECGMVVTIPEKEMTPTVICDTCLEYFAGQLHDEGVADED